MWMEEEGKGKLGPLFLAAPHTIQPPVSHILTDNIQVHYNFLRCLRHFLKHHICKRNGKVEATLPKLFAVYRRHVSSLSVMRSMTRYIKAMNFIKIGRVIKLMGRASKVLTRFRVCF